MTHAQETIEELRSIAADARVLAGYDIGALSISLDSAAAATRLGAIFNEAYKSVSSERKHLASIESFEGMIMGAECPAELSAVQGELVSWQKQQKSIDWGDEIFNYPSFTPTTKHIQSNHAFRQEKAELLEALRTTKEAIIPRKRLQVQRTAFIALVASCIQLCRTDKVIKVLRAENYEHQLKKVTAQLLRIQPLLNQSNVSLTRWASVTSSLMSILMELQT
ncbi:hypothetical protein HK097_002911 [Rhizophlyctis rosea]|uniref:Uncharacterized protein n=1 Tax=Rhizophlyctis rosea TaxID=64517 RepID=A0AAD5SI69_9FUNG|nr:hypothetical protein HK097_002911 [Rhizophlyctis rosea]